ncbi:duodenase-1-like isoform X2 [Rhinatrema bivittatum]|uniref:duodenase-1-like isoform X2 n=1 Tax=Rhinatrema bivittatum TaxID=194408 RepID=UPI001129991B|nr:duodenase-1-like isoform X2 [Rhinatrema bivittatum]
MKMHLPTLLAILLYTRAGIFPDEAATGREAIPHSKPHMAFLNIKKVNGSMVCGGFLVREDFVVTAAHCYSPGDHIDVLLGAHDIMEHEKTQQWFPVLRYFPHPHFNQRTFSNDIMLLQLNGKARFTLAVSPIVLPITAFSTSRAAPGSICNVAGWGRTDIYNQSTTHRLQEVDLEVINRNICKMYYPGFESGPSVLCVGDPGKKQGSFGGDSGGPLMCQGVVEGIVSYGKIHGIPPSVFTRISPFLPWITYIMKTAAPTPSGEAGQGAVAPLPVKAQGRFPPQTTEKQTQMHPC